MSVVEFGFEVPGAGTPTQARPLSYNKRRHWAVTKREMAPWRMLIAAAWREVPEDQRELVRAHYCRVTYHLPFPDRRRRDPSNWVAPFVKGGNDQLVREGAWVDDDSEHLTVAEPVLYVGTELRIVIEALRPL